MVAYERFSVGGSGEQIELFCRDDKEAAKLFALYLDHKISLPKLDDCSRLKVSVSNEAMHCDYLACKGQAKIFVEAVYFKKVRVTECAVFSVLRRGLLSPIEYIARFISPIAPMDPLRRREVCCYIMAYVSNSPVHTSLRARSDS